MTQPSTLDAPARRSPGRNGISSVWFTLPAVLVFAAFAVAPLLGTFGLSFANWDGIGAITWNGLGNWTHILSSSQTLNSIGVTFLVLVLSLLVQVPISLLLGVFTAGLQRYRAVLAVLYFLPLLFSSAAVAVAFAALLDPSFGLGSSLKIPLLSQDWLGNPTLAVGVVVFVLAWQHIPFYSLVFQGGVRQIPRSLYEAAELDGAGKVQAFFTITLPQLKYTTITATTLIATSSLMYFDLIFVLTGGGPGNATRVLPVESYVTGFRASNMGGAAVLGVLIAIFGLGLALLIQRLGGRNRQSSQMEGA